MAGTSAATTEPTVRAHDAVIDVEGSTLGLELDVSSYREHTSGVGSAPLFGLAKPMGQGSPSIGCAASCRSPRA